jgi:hypothetical protein
VKYEFMGGGGVAITVSVIALEEVASGLYFPTEGSISVAGDERINAFAVVGDVLINQGLQKQDFDIVFPAGTKVIDEIQELEYVVGAQE